MDGKQMAAATLFLVSFGVFMVGLGGDKPHGMPVDVSNSEQFVILNHGQEISKITADGEDLSSYLSSITIMEGNITGIQYGVGQEMHDLDMALYERMRGRMQVGESFYAIPTHGKTSMEVFGNETEMTAYRVGKSQ